MKIKNLFLFFLITIQPCFALSTNSNPQLTTNELLGFSKNSKVLLIHADDLGSVPSANQAFLDLQKEKIVKSGSVMMPAPYAERFIQKHNQLDIGLHLTLHSEWKNHRWKPVSPPSDVPSLIDFNGHQLRGNLSLFLQAYPAEIEKELRAQIEKAKSLGLNPTHLDTHKGSLFLKRSWFKIYLKLAKEYQIPPLLPKSSKWLSRIFSVNLNSFFPKRKKHPFILIDHLKTDLDGETLLERKISAANFIKNLKPGVTQLIIHPAYHNWEFEQKVINSSPKEIRRPLDALVFQSKEIKKLLLRENIKMIGWRDIQKIYQW